MRTAEQAAQDFWSHFPKFEAEGTIMEMTAQEFAAYAAEQTAGLRALLNAAKGVLADADRLDPHGVTWPELRAAVLLADPEGQR